MKKILLSLVILLTWLADAAAQTPYFQNKTILITVGYQAGDGYDIWARLLAAHIGKHIPGNPNLIKNMPGAAR
jgi:tripartite-type tricarboxylate transporter receptor subunit TctC